MIQQVREQTNRQEASPGRVESEAKPESSTANKRTREEREQELKLINEARSISATRPSSPRHRIRHGPPGSAVRAIRERYSGQQFDALTISTDCRSTLCRIDFSFSYSAAGPTAVKELIEPPLAKPTVHTFRPGDETRRFVFGTGRD